MSYVSFTALSQVVGEVVVDVWAEPVAVLWVQSKDLSQCPNTDVLQVAVGQRLHVCVCLYHLGFFWEVSPNKVTFACRDKRDNYGKVQNSRIVQNE